MRSEQVVQAYEAIKPDELQRAAMLSKILKAAEEPPAKKPRRWVVPALGAAAALLCMLTLPEQVSAPPETTEPPAVQAERPPVTAAPPRPMLGAAAPQQADLQPPETLTVEGTAYDKISSAPADLQEDALGEELDLLPEGTVYAHGEQQIALVTPAGIFLYEERS